MHIQLFFLFIIITHSYYNYHLDDFFSHRRDVGAMHTEVIYKYTTESG